ncbi:MAG: uncharacterized protein A8A55_1010 [Amphiamblys sp. WSBS2006]|nr:MAG: uncharacterized protein A8A55_1010 [Amphiamblys sp. WSBS2006]
MLSRRPCREENRDPRIFRETHTKQARLAVLPETIEGSCLRETPGPNTAILSVPNTALPKTFQSTQKIPSILRAAMQASRSCFAQCFPGRIPPLLETCENPRPVRVAPRKVHILLLPETDKTPKCLKRLHKTRPYSVAQKRGQDAPEVFCQTTVHLAALWDGCNVGGWTSMYRRTKRNRDHQRNTHKTGVIGAGREKEREAGLSEAQENRALM